jgi:replicative DNA helicase
MILSDAPAERAVLAAICRYGSEAYHDVADIVDEKSFTIESNSMIYACLKHVMDKDITKLIDLPTILSGAKEIGLHGFVSDKQEIQHLAAVMKFPVVLKNARQFAGKVRKLQIARMMHDQLEVTKGQYLEVKGDESISHILGIAEESIFDFTGLLNDTEDSPKKVFGDIEGRLDELSESPLDQVGIPTGFDRYDFAIGGGLRRGTVNVIGARPKIGKTLFAENAGIYIAKELNIPVLNLDTEMMRQDHQDRGMAMLTEVPISEIETGQFSNSAYKDKKLRDMAKEVRDIPYYHKTIGGKPLEDQLSIMRRWISKEVGLNHQGKAKDCVIVYDYLKIMDAAEIKGDMKEYQALGFLMTSLHNFAIRYEVPILAFIQLNRDGITKESTDTASGSDRIVWLCSNFTIYKRKSDEEIAKDGPEHGNRKLVPLIARHGEGLEDKDYINMKMIGKYGQIIEGQTAFELETGVSTAASADTHDHQSDIENDDIPFV